MKMNLENVFTYHAPTGTQPTRYSQIREKAKEFASLIQASTPESREQSLALTSVQQAVMWANAAIAINETETPHSETGTFRGPDDVKATHPRATSNPTEA